MLVTFPVIRQW
ncbi:hypothetical protein YPPY101_0896, partial [Yersinia pestis PY-101]